MLRVIMPSGCRGKPATNKHRMNQQLSSFAARLRETILVGDDMRSLCSNTIDVPNNGPSHGGFEGEKFGSLAMELFALQYKYNFTYRKICEGRKQTPRTIEHWTQIPAVPAAAFKELELTSLPPEQRTAVFHSSGTTEQKPSRHFHNAESLAVYEASLISWFLESVPPDLRFAIHDLRLICLTPPPALLPHSSLVYMFDAVRREYSLVASIFVGQLDEAGSWTLDFVATYYRLEAAINSGQPVTILGTAFSFVHLLDYLVSKDLVFNLPEGSLMMETGGYKNRSRSMPKAELHALITERLNVTRENIICEYGMSELSSQAYDCEIHPSSSIRHPRVFRFPPWARVQIISPETGREVAEGETGLIRVFDLANVFSVAAVQTEDLGIRRGDGFELIGRALQTEPRGCSLMAA
jgi:Acyl-protein synthetase, LuxE